MDHCTVDGRPVGAARRGRPHRSRRRTASSAHARSRAPPGTCTSRWCSARSATGSRVLTRVHSECLTGDALGSLRCDCGVQLRSALRNVAAEGRGIVLYLNGHEGRGIGLVNKLRAYVEQDAGADTVDANLRLGLHADLRDYGDAAAILRSLGVRSVRLLSNNPGKAAGLRRHGVEVESLQPLRTAANRHNRGYLETKQARLGHLRSTGPGLDELPAAPVDVGTPARLAAAARRPALRRPEVRPDARRADRHPDRRREVDQRRAGAAGLARDACRRATRSSSARAPCCRTTRSSPCGWSRERRRCAWSWTRRCGRR